MYTSLAILRAIGLMEFYLMLQLNVLVRDVFELGEPMLVGTGATNKPTKWERVSCHTEA